MDHLSHLNSGITITGVTIDYVWFLKNGISLLIGIGPAKFNYKKELNNWEELSSRTSYGWSWGLLNMGYMF